MESFSVEILHFELKALLIGMANTITLFTSSTEHSKFRDILIILYCGLIASWFILKGLFQNWDYFPEWLSNYTSFVKMVNIGLPITLCFFGPLILLCLIDSLHTNIQLIRSGNLIGTKRLLLVTSAIIALYLIRDGLILILGVLLFGTAIVTDSAVGLINYASSRYDPVIDAINEYHEKYGQYPDNLGVLIPEYLSELPGIYMQFGETLTYEQSVVWYDSAPFTFELHGSYKSSLNGQLLKYCPIEAGTCFEVNEYRSPNRINDRWILVYSSW